MRELRLTERPGKGARCCYCKDSLGDERTTCDGCAAVYHRDCAGELDGRCATPGCVEPLGGLIVRARERAVEVPPVEILGPPSWSPPRPARLPIRWVAALLAIVAPLLVVGGVVGLRWRAERAAIEALEATRRAAVEARKGELAGLTQSLVTMREIEGASRPGDLERARVLYAELARELEVDRAFVLEQARRGGGAVWGHRVDPVAVADEIVHPPEVTAPIR